MEEKVLYNVLKNIRRDKSDGGAAPDREYIKSLANIGLITNDWDMYLTSLGESMLNLLKKKFEKW